MYVHANKSSRQFLFANAESFSVFGYKAIFICDEKLNVEKMTKYNKQNMNAEQNHEHRFLFIFSNFISMQTPQLPQLLFWVFLLLLLFISYANSALNHSGESPNQYVRVRYERDATKQ